MCVTFLLFFRTLRKSFMVSKTPRSVLVCLLFLLFEESAARFFKLFNLNLSNQTRETTQSEKKRAQLLLKTHFQISKPIKDYVTIKLTRAYWNITTICTSQRYSNGP